MFIIKFNNMIRNKWLWGAFAIVVAGAFIMSDSMVAQQGDSGIGKLNGEPVSNQEFNNVYRIVDLNRNMGRNFCGEECSLEKETWMVLAALRTAKEEFNIVIPDEVVVAPIINDPMFLNDSGVFDKAIAETILQRFYNISLTQYEEFLRTYMTIERLREYVLSTVSVVPESEVKLGVDAMTDTFTFTPAYYTNSIVLAEVEVTEDELKTYYESHKEAYRVPSKISVRQIAFEASKFVDPSAVTEEEIEYYYEEYKAIKFAVPATDGGEVTYRPLEEVRELIVADVAREASELKAYEAADEFNTKLINNSSLTMEELAAEYGYTIVTTDLFSQNAPAPVVMQNSQEYIESAFSLIDGDDYINYVDEPIFAKSQTFVIAYNSHQPSYIPALEEIRAEVLRDAQVERRYILFDAKVDEISKAISEIQTSGKTFESVVAEFGLTVGANITTSVRNVLMTAGSPEEKLMIDVVSKLQKGDVSAPVAVSNDSVAVLLVVDRASGSDEEKMEIEPFVRYSLQADVAPRMWYNWLGSNLVSMDFETTMSLEEETTGEIEE